MTDKIYLSKLNYIDDLGGHKIVKNISVGVDLGNDKDYTSVIHAEGSCTFSCKIKTRKWYKKKKGKRYLLYCKHVNATREDIFVSSLKAIPIQDNDLLIPKTILHDILCKRGEQ